MSFNGLKNKNFYEDLDMRYIEVGILLEDIELPKLPTVQDILEGKVTTFRAEELYTDTIGKFCIPILFPLEETAKDKEVIHPVVRNITNDCNLIVSPYQTSNYIELNIPKYILLNFLDIIPAGTRFLLCFIGGDIEIEDIRVIGVCEYASIN